MKILLSMFTILLSCSANANIFSIEDVDTVSHSKIYNKLLYIEDSDRKLKQFPHFEKFLKASEEVVCRYDLAEHVGLRLIHRHFDLQEGQIMIENFQVVKDVPSLVTNAYNILEVQEEEVKPSSWFFTQSISDPISFFEFSSDPSVKQGIKKLEKDYEFFDEIKKVTEEFEIQTLMAISLLKRENLIAKDNEEYREINYEDISKSIVQIANVDEHDSINIRTTWSFKGPRQVGCVPSWKCISTAPWGKVGHFQKIWHANT